MPGLEVFPAEVGNLILLKAPAPEGLHRGQVHIRLGVVIGERRVVPHLIQRRALLHLQAVAADVLRVQLQHIVQGVLPGLQGLPRQAVDQIHGDIPEACLADALEGADRLGVGVGPTNFLEDFVVVALDAQADPVEALGPEPVEQPVVDGIGVCLEGDLRIGGDIEAAPDGGEKDRQSVGPKEAGRAAAKVDGIHLVIGRQSPRLLDMVADRVQIAVQKVIVLGRQRIKVAILALTAAEGHVDVNAQGRFVGLTCNNRHRNLRVLN